MNVRSFPMKCCEMDGVQLVFSPADANFVHEIGLMMSRLENGTEAVDTDEFMEMLRHLYPKFKAGESHSVISLLEDFMSLMKGQPQLTDGIINVSYFLLYIFLMCEKRSMFCRQRQEKLDRRPLLGRSDQVV